MTPARMLDVPVAGGALRAAVWEPGDATHSTPTLLAVHGVTSSHLAWQWLAAHLPHTRIIAPDLRGRGGSRDVRGGAGMARHADDLAAVLEAAEADRALVVGHSMGAFAAAVLSHRHPHLVDRLLLIDGGLPLDVPDGLDPDVVVARVLGPTAERLAMRFADLDAYLEFWRRHPAFAGGWNAVLEQYLAYDLVADGDGFVPATRYDTVRDDTIDLNNGTAVVDALDALTHPTRLLTVSRGLVDEPPGLYAPAHLQRLLARWPGIDHERSDAFNHYTVVMSDAGGRCIAVAVSDELTRVAVARR